jgi:DNA-binding IclR family transcriptional regulator
MPQDYSEAQVQQLTRSVAKAFGILEVFGERAPQLTFGEISDAVDLAPTTLRRLLVTLESLGYVARDPHGRYQLGVRALNLAPAALAAYDIRTQALPMLDELATKAGLNANLGVLRDGRLLYIASIVGNLPRRRHFSVPGRLALAHSNALGKVILADLDFAAARTLLEKAGGLVARTPKTITNWDEFEAELAQVREQGYAVDEEEATVGGRCVAAPIHDRSGAVVAAISASGMIWEIPPESVHDLAATVIRCAETLSFKLGYSFATEW